MPIFCMNARISNLQRIGKFLWSTSLGIHPVTNSYVRFTSLYGVGAALCHDVTACDETNQHCLPEGSFIVPADVHDFLFDKGYMDPNVSYAAIIQSEPLASLLFEMPESQSRHTDRPTHTLTHSLSSLHSLHSLHLTSLPYFTSLTFDSAYFASF